MNIRKRYIFCGVVNEEDSISDFRLIAGKALAIMHGGMDSAIRVNIPDDLELIKYSCDRYSTTDDSRTIAELGYDVVRWNGKKWEVCNELKGIQPHLHYRYFNKLNTINELKNYKGL